MPSFQGRRYVGDGLGPGPPHPRLSRGRIPRPRAKCRCRVGTFGDGDARSVSLKHRSHCARAQHRTRAGSPPRLGLTSADSTISYTAEPRYERAERGGWTDARLWPWFLSPEPRHPSSVTSESSWRSPSTRMSCSASSVGVSPQRATIRDPGRSRRGGRCDSIDPSKSPRIHRLTAAVSTFAYVTRRRQELLAVHLGVRHRGQFGVP